MIGFLCFYLIFALSLQRAIGRLGGKYQGKFSICTRDDLDHSRACFSSFSFSLTARVRSLNSRAPLRLVNSIAHTKELILVRILAHN